MIPLIADGKTLAALAATFDTPEFSRLLNLGFGEDGVRLRGQSYGLRFSLHVEAPARAPTSITVCATTLAKVLQLLPGRVGVSLGRGFRYSESIEEAPDGAERHHPATEPVDVLLLSQERQGGRSIYELFAQAAPWFPEPAPAPTSAICRDLDVGKLVEAVEVIARIVKGDASAHLGGLWLLATPGSGLRLIGTDHGSIVDVELPASCEVTCVRRLLSDRVATLLRLLKRVETPTVDLSMSGDWCRFDAGPAAIDFLAEEAAWPGWRSGEVAFWARVPVAALLGAGRKLDEGSVYLSLGDSALTVEGHASLPAVTHGAGRFRVYWPNLTRHLQGRKGEVTIGVIPGTPRVLRIDLPGLPTYHLAVAKGDDADESPRD